MRTDPSHSSTAASLLAQLALLLAAWPLLGGDAPADPHTRLVPLTTGRSFQSLTRYYDTAAPDKCVTFDDVKGADKPYSYDGATQTFYLIEKKAASVDVTLTGKTANDSACRLQFTAIPLPPPDQLSVSPIGTASDIPVVKDTDLKLASVLPKESKEPVSLFLDGVPCESGVCKLDTATVATKKISLSAKIGNDEIFRRELLQTTVEPAQLYLKLFDASSLPSANTASPTLSTTQPRPLPNPVYEGDAICVGAELYADAQFKKGPLLPRLGPDLATISSNEVDLKREAYRDVECRGGFAFRAMRATLSLPWSIHLSDVKTVEPIGVEPSSFQVKELTYLAKIDRQDLTLLEDQPAASLRVSFINQRTSAPAVVPFTLSPDYTTEPPEARSQVSVSFDGVALSIGLMAVQDAAQRVPSFRVTVSFLEGNKSVVARATLLVRATTVVNFAQLNVNLSPLDDITAKDLFGPVLARDYHVARVRIFNNARGADQRLLQASVLAFSSSLEVGVVLEKRSNPDARPEERGQSNRAKGPEWQRVIAAEDLADVVDRASLEAFRNSQAATARKEETRAGSVFESAACADVFRYRPISNDSMAITVDQRYARSARGWTFKFLSAAGTVASFVGSISSVGSSYEPTLNAYTNILIPGVNLVWPNLTEVHRQNILAYGMKNIEEIPFGSEISRYVFFPKGEIRGLLPQNVVRIAAICPFYFKIEVAVLTKGSRGAVESSRSGL